MVALACLSATWRLPYHEHVKPMMDQSMHLRITMTIRTQLTSSLKDVKSFVCVDHTKHDIEVEYVIVSDLSL